jgi:RNA-directed DNA polymerase
MSLGIQQLPELSLAAVAAWGNLLSAWRQAAAGKRGGRAAAHFEHHVARRLIGLRDALLARSWRPGPYQHFSIHEPKRRIISAAPFADRVVHHALCNVIEPHFERLFAPQSYANRLGKGSHRAIDDAQRLSRRYPWVLRMDVVQHFPAIDHAILRRTLHRVLKDADLMALAGHIIASGDGVPDQRYDPVLFPGDDLLAACRPRGLPIGNLTSQFWSNCYMHPFDQFVTRELGCRAYLRYVDDMLLFADDKARLWDWRRRCIDRLARLRLTIHTESAQVQPSRCGIPWLGFVLFPDHRRVKGRKVRSAARQLEAGYRDWRAGRISFATFDAGVQGWINHVRYADTWGLRGRILRGFDLRPVAMR